jgi:sulfur carrier protein ThiS
MTDTLTDRPALRAVTHARAADAVREPELLSGAADAFILDRAFGSEPRHVPVPEGSSILEALEIGDVAPKRARRCVVQLDGVTVPQTEWESRRLKAGERLAVGIRPGRGKSSPLRILLQLVLFAVSVFFPAASPWAIGLVNVLGRILDAALVKPPQRKEDPAEKPSYAVEGASNELRLFGQVPVVLGERRVVLLHAARPYSEIVGDDVHYRMLLTAGLGPAQISDILIGATPPGVYTTPPEIEIRTGAPGEPPVTLFTTSPREASIGATLVGAGSWTERFTEEGTDEISMDWLFERGLVRFDSDGKRKETSVTLDIKWKRADEPDREDQSEWLTVLPTAEQAETAARTVAGDSASRLQITSLADYVAWRTAMAAAGAEDSEFTVTAADTKPVRRNKRWAVPPAQYRVATRRVTADAGSDRISDEVQWSVLRSVESAPPKVPEGATLVAIAIKASDQLQGTIEPISALVTSIRPTWDGTAFTGAAPTRNPGDLIVAALTGPGNSRPQPLSRLAIANLGAFAELCTARGWYADFVIEDGRSVADTVRQIAACGRGAMTRIDGRFGVWADVPRVTSGQLYTPRNSRGFKARKRFVPEVHALRIPFPNREKEHRTDELTVYADGYTKENATLIEVMPVDGVTDPDQIHEMGRYYLAQLKLRPESYSLTADVEHAASAVGDVAYLQHDAILVGIASARVVMRLVNEGGLVIGVRLDDEVPMQDGTLYGLRIRRSDLTFDLPVVTEEGFTTDVMFVDPVAANDAPRAGDLVSFGVRGLETIEAVCTRKGRPAADKSVELEFEPYGHPGIDDATTGPIPPWDSAITLPFRPRPPTPSVVGVVWREDGIILDFAIPPNRAQEVAGFAVRWRETPPSGAERAWERLPDLRARDRRLVTPAPQLGVYMDVELTAFDPTGKSGVPVQRLAIVPVDDVPEPAIVSVIGIAKTGPGGAAVPAIRVVFTPNVEDRILRLVVQVGPEDAAEADFVSAGALDPKAGKGEVAINAPPGGVVDVRFRHETRRGAFSDWIRSDSVGLSDLVASDSLALGGIDAETVLAGVADAVSDGVLTPAEKLALRPPLEKLISTQTLLDDRATALGITTEKTAFDSAMTTLNAFLATLTTPFAWNNQSGNTNVTAATLISAYKAALEKQIALQDAIDREAAKIAVWGGVLSRPTELTDGRITAGLNGLGDLNRNITTARRDGSSLLGYTAGGLYSGDLNATLGAAWSVNLTGKPGNLAGLGGTESILNDQVDAVGSFNRNPTFQVWTSTHPDNWSANGTATPTKDTTNKVFGGWSYSIAYSGGAAWVANSAAADMSVPPEGVPSIDWDVTLASGDLRRAGFLYRVGYNGGFSNYKDYLISLYDEHPSPATGARYRRAKTMAGPYVGGSPTGVPTGAVLYLMGSYSGLTGGSDSTKTLRWNRVSVGFPGFEQYSAFLGLDAAGDLNRNITTGRRNTSSLLGYTSGGLYSGDLNATLGAAWGSTLTGRPGELTDGRIVAGLDGSGDLNRNITTGRRNTSSLLGYTSGGLYSGDLNATLGAAWGSTLTGRPGELTDGRIVAGLDGSGDLNRNITTGRRNTSSLLGYASGGLYSGDLNATLGAAWGSTLTGRPGELTDGRIVAGLDGSGDLNRNITTGRRNTSSLLGYASGGLYSGDLNATLGAAWGSTLTGRPGELTDGRIAAGLDGSGDLNRNITTGRRNASSLLGYTSGGLYSGDLNATLGAAWGSNVTGRPYNIAVLGGSESLGAGANQAINSSFKKGPGYGWRTPGGVPVLPNGVSYDWTLNYNAGTLANGAVVDFGVTEGMGWSGAAWTPDKFGMSVRPGDTVFFSCMAGQRAAYFQLYLLCFSETGALVHAPYVQDATDYSADAAAGNGHYVHYKQIGNTTVIPSGCAWAALMFRIVGTGAANASGYVIRPAMGKLAAGQTYPTYEEGPPDRFADQTSVNTALAYAGQTAWGTYSTRTPTQNAYDVARAAGGDTLTENATFSDFPASGSLPTDWFTWASNQTISRDTGFFSPFGFRQATTNQECGIYQSSGDNPALAQMRPGFYVIEADITLNSGSLAGAGVFLYEGSGTPSASIAFHASPDVSNTVVGTGTAGRRYSWKTIVDWTASANLGGVCHLMTDWAGFNGARVAKDITWHRCSVRHATAQEIASYRGLDFAGDLNRNITTGRRNTSSLLGYASGGLYSGDLNATLGAAYSTNLTGLPSGFQVSNMENLGGGDYRLRSWYVRDVSSGAYLHDRWPAEYGANVTESRTALAIAGQGWGALASQAAVEDLAYSNGVNLLPNSEWMVGAPGMPEGYQNAWDGTASGTKTFGLDLYAWSGNPIRTAFKTCSGAQSSGPVFDVIGTKGGSLAELQQYAARVQPGARIFAGAYVGTHRCGADIGVIFKRGDGTDVSSGGEVHSVDVGENGSYSFAWGYPQNARWIGGFHTVPSDATFAVWFARGHCNGGSDPYLFVGCPMICHVSANQTAFPTFNNGQGSRLSSSSFYGTASPSGRTGSRAGVGNLTLSSITVSPVNNVGSVSYAWVQMTGSGTVSFSASTSATTSFTKPVVVGENQTLTARCYMTDSVTGRVAFVDVSLTFVETT